MVVGGDGGNGGKVIFVSNPTAVLRLYCRWGCDNNQNNMIVDHGGLYIQAVLIGMIQKSFHKHSHQITWILHQYQYST